MYGQVSRRTSTEAGPASLLAFGNPATSFAQTPETSPEEDRYPDLLDKLAATDPEITLDLLLETRFDGSGVVPLATYPPFEAKELDPSENEAFGTEMIGMVDIAHPERDVSVGGFVVFPDETLAADAIERAQRRQCDRGPPDLGRARRGDGPVQ